LEKQPIENYLTDERFALNLFGAGLIYHTDPFPVATELTGNVKFVAWISMDVPDTDFEVLLYEIRADGSSVFLTEDRMRARYRESLENPKPVPPGEVIRYEFHMFSFFSRRIAEGSRLRVVFKSPNTIYWQKNYNSGGAVADESGKDARTAHVTLHHHGNYLSYLEIPIGK
jgi:putative CocE/NonD family hydrolase